MRDEYDDLKDQLLQISCHIEKGDTEKERMYRDPTPIKIADEVVVWWDSIHDGSVTFIDGLPLLSEYIPAYIPGHVIIISGYTSAGKSQLLAQIAEWCAGSKKANTLIISVEDARMEKLNSLVSCVSGDIHRRQLLLNSLSQEERSRVINIFSTISEWPLRIYDDVYSLDEIEYLVQKHKPKIVILDYVQNLTINFHSIYERMSYASQRIFKMAQDYKVTFIVASQVSNAGAREPNQDVIDLKGAGELAAAAHSVIQLRKGREEKNWSKVKVQILKNKAFGKCGEIECRFNHLWTRIEKEEVEHDEYRNYTDKD